MKCCVTCGHEKPETDFRPHHRKCKSCSYIRKRELERQNRESYNAHRREYANAYRLKNLEKVRAKEQAYRDSHREEYRKRQYAGRKRRQLVNPEADKAYGHWYRTGPNRAKYLASKKATNQRRREKQRAYERKRWATDPEFKLKCRLRWFLRMGLNGQSKTNRAIDLLGCSIEDFKLYLESKFTQGMSWETYGGETGWELDHIMPCAIFDLTNPEHQRRCFHFSNLQPLWRDKNIAKSDKVLNAQFQLI